MALTTDLPLLPWLCLPSPAQSSPSRLCPGLPPSLSPPSQLSR
jgi:hypothetical protein